MLGNAFVYWVLLGFGTYILNFSRIFQKSDRGRRFENRRYEKVVFLFLDETVKLKIETLIAFSNPLNQLTTSMNTITQYICY